MGKDGRKFWDLQINVLNISQNQEPPAYQMVRRAVSLDEICIQKIT